VGTRRRGNGDVRVLNDVTNDALAEKDVEDQPLSIFFPIGKCTEIFSSFHNTGAASFDQITILYSYIFAFGCSEMQSLSLALPISMQNNALTMSAKQNFSGKIHRLNPANSWEIYSYYPEI